MENRNLVEQYQCMNCLSLIPLGTTGSHSHGEHNYFFPRKLKVRKSELKKIPYHLFGVFINYSSSVNNRL